MKTKRHPKVVWAADRLWEIVAYRYRAEDPLNWVMRRCVEGTLAASTPRIADPWSAPFNSYHN